MITVLVIINCLEIKENSFIHKSGLTRQRGIIVLILNTAFVGVQAHRTTFTATLSALSRINECAMMTIEAIRN